ncbi:hypothetical protein [Natrarchaeobaculum aegyptiacum]|uniref:Uncharacterized protein n=1 Tax=Natrarchaeobaculum aegyptiacum TaxID=745377 RepID=A0A2Z2HR49_9EURY|nr:hypothetical protein [Natrarchaeobaculum aegyptiacum]ARS88515.1 hypothetical protein B1756_01260 [Natrarchaeobaculum aegyptiacum]
MPLESLPHESVLVAVSFVTIASFVVAGLCLCLAIAMDANARGGNGILWGLGTFVFPPLVPVYPFYRIRYPARVGPAGRIERWIGAFGVGGVSAMVAANVLAPPDPFSLIIYGLPLLVVFVPLALVGCYRPGWRAIVS